ncbi:MAG TPA: M4 family metallopeptidase [Thermoanaerobaculia bacterium]|nr:M4 family metallopeptidase [Thermoanaerobaculia bacterium]
MTRRFECRTVSSSGCQTIVPPYILDAISKRGDADERAHALETLLQTERLRGHREALDGTCPAVPAGEERRTVYDDAGSSVLPGKLVRGEGGHASKDPAVNEAYDGAGATYDFYEKVYCRSSIDGKGMRLDSSVHYGRQFDNAFWNGSQMVYGDGDGRIFNRFTLSLDVIGHELTHGVTGTEANFDYEGQPGALNESFSDVFGSLVKQWYRNERAAEADWIIGAGLFTAKVKGRGIRSMLHPGTAYDDPVLGKDPQPAAMRDFYDGYDDNGGVHINSGIPNRAFALAAVAIGGFAWEKAGRIWYTALTERLRNTADFRAAAAATIAIAGELFGSVVEKAVEDAWRTVGVTAAAHKSVASA